MVFLTAAFLAAVFFLVAFLVGAFLVTFATFGLAVFLTLFVVLVTLTSGTVTSLVTDFLALFLSDFTDYTDPTLYSQGYSRTAAQKKDFLLRKSFRSPYGNRTRVSAVRGRRLNRLTNEPFIILPDGLLYVKGFF